MGGVRNISIFQFIRARERKNPRAGPAHQDDVEVSVPFPDIQDIQGKMPFYQVLCIAAHNPEYVRDETFCIHTLLFHLGRHSDKSKALSA